MSQRPQKLLPWSSLTGLLVLTLGYTFFLVPSDEDMAFRLINDGEFTQAERRLERMQSTATTEQTLATVDQLQQQLTLAKAVHLGTELSLAASRRIINQLLNNSTSPSQRVLLLKGLALSQQLPAPPEIELSGIRAVGSDAISELRDALVQRALAENQPALAAAWYEALLTDAATDTEVLRALELWQAAALPHQALRCIESHRTGLDWDLLRIEFNLQAGQPHNALKISLAAIAANPASWESALPPARLVELAGYADRLDLAVPILADFYKRHPSDHSIRQYLIRAYLADGQLDQVRELLIPDATTTVSPQDQQILAQIEEWTGRPAQAFELYLALAQLGDSGSIDRLLALNPGIKRNEELAQVLETLPSDQLSEAQIRGLLQLQVNIGKYQKAAQTITTLLEQDPQEIELWTLLGNLKRAQYDLPGASAAYSSGLQHAPNNLPLLRSRAETYSRMRRHKQAGADYQNAYLHSQSLDDLSQAIQISRLMGDWDAFHAALEVGIQAGHLPSAANYIDLYNRYLSQANHDAAESTLRAGVLAYPQDLNLKLSLVYFFSNKGKNLLALETIDQYPELKKESSIRELYLDLALRSNQSARARNFLEALPTQAWQSNPPMLETAAYMYETLGENAKAEPLYQMAYQLKPGNINAALKWASILCAQGKSSQARAILDPLLINPTPAVLKMAAEMYASIGDYAAAEQLMIQMLHLNHIPASNEWGLLGDIRLSRGDQKGAKQAYNFAAIELTRTRAVAAER
ncbi:MAG: putative Zn-dependent protease [Lentimonas sp.]|jgi:predicted Zn-dependent protease